MKNNDIFVGMVWGVVLFLVLVGIFGIGSRGKEFEIFDCLSKHTVEECKIKFDIKN